MWLHLAKADALWGDIQVRENFRPPCRQAYGLVSFELSQLLMLAGTMNRPCTSALIFGPFSMEH